MKNNVKIISWALNGVYYDYTREGYGNCSCTTYLNPDIFFQKLLNEEFSNEIFSGAWVINKEKIVEENPGLVISSPLVDLNLPANSIKKFINNEQINHVSLDSRHIYELKPLDYVGIDIYTEWWRKKGAIIGKIANDGKIVVWE